MSNSSKLRLDDQLCFALYTATNAITRAYRPLLEAIGVTYPQYLVLMVLWENDLQQMGAIAERLDLPPNAMSPLIARMETAGWLQRRPDPTDRRCMKVQLTEGGKTLERAAFQAQKTVASRTQLNFERFHRLRKELFELTTVLEEQGLHEH